LLKAIKIWRFFSEEKILEFCSIPKKEAYNCLIDLGKPFGNG
jgi:hypothetical protein